jgi:hypothetical protein
VPQLPDLAQPPLLQPPFHPRQGSSAYHNTRAIQITNDPVKPELISVDAFFTQFHCDQHTIALEYVPSELQLVDFFNKVAALTSLAQTQCFRSPTTILSLKWDAKCMNAHMSHEAPYIYSSPLMQFASSQIPKIGAVPLSFATHLSLSFHGC